jgi:Ca2+:H+ antiporter
MPANSFAHILVVGVSALIIPSLLSGTSLDLGVDVPPNQLLLLARGIAVVMMLLYGCYIFFSGWTHHYLYDGDSTREMLDDGEEQSRPQTAVILFTLAIALLTISAAYAIDALADLTNPLHTSQKLIIFLFFPFLSHPADIIHCIELAVAGEIDLFLNLVLENSAGTVSYLNPLFVVIGWAFKKPFLVEYEGIQLLALLMAAFLTSSYTFADGKGHWLKGWTLVAM